VAVAASIAIAGFYLGRKIPSPKVAQTALSAPAPAAIVEDAKAPDNSVAVLERDKSNLETQLTELRTELTDAKAAQDSLRSELSAANEKLASFQRARTAAQENSREVQDSKTQGVGKHLRYSIKIKLRCDLHRYEIRIWRTDNRCLRAGRGCRKEG
jgi:septal ring factor EnvC (AmiA/AmiB activator)